MHLRIGSRGSQLALWQARHIAASLHNLGHTTEVLIIRTTGDRLQDPAFAAANPVTPELDAKGIFIKEIEEALLSSAIDLAVHSLKDLPTTLDPRFALAAIPHRADPCDALLCPDWFQLHTLPDQARIGTTSPRRIAQVLSHRPDLRFVAIRGNIDTRIRKLRDGHCDALILACAGLDRLGNRVLAPIELHPAHPEFGRTPHIECLTHPGHEHHAEEDTTLITASGSADWIRQRFTPDILCPAPGQGALAIEIRATDDATRTTLLPLDHAPTRYAVEAERHLLHALGGGCMLPVGALCTNGCPPLLHATVTAPDGEQMISVELTATPNESAQSLGVRAATSLIAQGALDLLSAEMAT